jgi:hypothetical protein
MVESSNAKSHHYSGVAGDAFEWQHGASRVDRKRVKSLNPDSQGECETHDDHRREPRIH